MPESAKARKRRKKKMKRKVVKKRNPFALIAKMRSGAGSHGRPDKQEPKRACRGKVEYDEQE